MNIYLDGFGSWKDVQEQFNMKDPEPDEVLFALYDTYGYEGDAIVIYRNGKKYFWAAGAHCSCYGLEDQWSPTVYDNKKQLIDALKMYGDKRKEWKEFVERFVGPTLK